MKRFKALTDGLAILLAVLILIMLAVNFVKFKPDTTKVEKGISKLYQFFDKTQSNRDYMRLAILLCLSSAISIIFRKRPELSVFCSSSVFAYILNMFSNKQLTEHPMVITILCLGHCAGCLVYCAYRDRFEEKHHLRNASVLCTAGSACLVGYILTYFLKFDKISDIFEEITQKGISISYKIKYDPQFIRLIYEKMKNSSAEDARILAQDFSYDTEVSSLKNYFLSSLDTEQKNSYSYLFIFLIVSVILIIFLNKKVRFVSAIVSAVPFIRVLFGAHTEKLSTLSLALIVLTCTAFLSCIADFDQYGRGHDQAYDPEEGPSDETGENPASCEDKEEVFFS